MDNELKSAGKKARWMISSSLWFFKLLNFKSRRSKGKSIAGIDRDEIFIPSSKGDSQIRVCIYKPENAAPNLPLILYLHGGGYAFGSPEAFEKPIKNLIKTKPCIVIAPAYRLSLQAPYPAAINDCYDALLWVKENADNLNGRDDQIIVIGHSAGGGLTAALSLRARDCGQVNIAYQMPMYPMIDDRMNTVSATNNTSPVWNSKSNKIGWDLYLKDLNERGEEVPSDAAPARAIDYKGLPPTMTFVGELDPFRDETRTYVDNLRKANVPVEYEEYNDGFHGFEFFAPRAKVSILANKFFYGSFAEAVETYFAPQDNGEPNQSVSASAKVIQSDLHKSETPGDARPSLRTSSK